MKINRELLNGVKILEPKVFGDERGYFFESFNLASIQKIIGAYEFVQDNQSRSRRGVLRGLHFQKPPKAQGKLLRVLQGTIVDVVVDLRRDSPSFRQWEMVTLSDENKQQIWIPVGFAHGFQVLSETAEILYKTTEYYAPETEACLFYGDKTLNIPWHANDPIISEKDQQGQSIDEIFSF